MHRLPSVVFACLTAVASAAPVPATPAPAAPPASGYALPADAAAPAPKAGPKVTYSQCNVDGPYIALTFDDGPHATNTPRLLDMLKQRKVKGTFFVVGRNVVEYPDIMKRIAAEGHELASHSWSHPQLTSMSESGVREELQKTHDAIIQTTGVTPKTMRPPYGAFTARQRAWAHDVWGYKCILWDVDPLDWKVRSADHVKSQILSKTVNGSIILTHDIHKSTIDAMPETIDGLLAKGFKFVTVSELIAMDRPVAPKPKATPAATPAAKADAPIPRAEAVSGAKPPTTAPAPTAKP